MTVRPAPNREQELDINVLLFCVTDPLGQVVGLWFVQHQLWIAGLSSQVQPLPPQGAGPKRQRPAGSRSGAAEEFPAESRLEPGDPEVSGGLEFQDSVTVTVLLCQFHASSLCVSCRVGKVKSPHKAEGSFLFFPLQLGVTCCGTLKSTKAALCLGLTEQQQLLFSVF